jgi:hypothetical protein
MPGSSGWQCGPVLTPRATWSVDDTYSRSLNPTARWYSITTCRFSLVNSTNVLCSDERECENFLQRNPNNPYIGTRCAENSGERLSRGVRAEKMTAGQGGVNMGRRGHPDCGMLRLTFLR